MVSKGKIIMIKHCQYLLTAREFLKGSMAKKKKEKKMMKIMCYYQGFNNLKLFSRCEF